ncbi:MAG: YaaL family protein [Firmicutes bacterium]|nr:YaaL family protein [Bacillota bacterium]
MANTMLQQWPQAKTTEINLINEIEEAHLEWQRARRFFESVTDPDLIDYAIYNLQAAERRYAYLLKLVRQEGREVI